MLLRSFYVCLSLFAGVFAQSGPVSCACTALNAQQPGSLLYPNSTQYETEVLKIWDRRGNRRPACIFVPQAADATAKAVGSLQKCNAPFAVLGGGHMNVPGSNNIDGGVLLSLTALDDLKLGSDQRTVEVGPGNTWIDVYQFLEPYGLVAIGGRLKTIGVPGLTLIGGVHYFLNKYGYAMDNVVSYEVALGNGDLVTANVNSNKDLFWALKGGANNFGVVTKFTLKAYPIPQISTTIQNFDESAVQGFIKATCDLAKNSDPSIGAGGVITITYDPTTKTVTPQLLGVQEGTESPPSRFANFSALPPVFKFDRVTTMREWASQLESPKQQYRIQFGQHAMKPDADQIYLMFQVWKKAVEAIDDVPGLNPVFVLNTAPATGAAVAKNNGVGNTWGLDDKESFIWWQLSTNWQRQEDDQKVELWQRILVETFHALNKKKNLSSEFMYMGDAAEWQDVFAGFPKANVDRMKEIRSKYDPKGVFTKLNTGGFKLPQ